ncbi:hypothetical protein IV500_12120 [Paeniglutamicibacter antarcticus]|uniref:HTH luxR-type domain-containing protein n=1 Tax=Arthrobacter terrae TaxID=2935737 RepID=A0A931G4U6_9MICC|nr:LuxR family transcriptional regulator [Arthrobacter terrae]MBG0740126.1 hypothetical protein [Arthrobacter terrae]
MEVVHIRCTESGSNRAYSALDFLLGGLDSSVTDNPLALLGVLQERLGDAGGGRPVVLFVDNAEDLDPWSATVFAQLARHHSARLLVVCQRMPNITEELSALWKDGLLARMDVGPLEPADTTDLLTAVLGAPVSGVLSRVFQDATGGNPLFLQALTTEQLASGQVKISGGFWVLGTRRLELGQHGFNRVDLRLRRLNPAQVNVLEVLALVGQVPLHLLPSLVDGEAVDQLQEQRLITVGPCPDLGARISCPLIRHVVRSRIPNGRSRQLLEHSLSLLGPVSAMAPPAQVAVVTWCLDCAVTVSPGDLLSAARAANALHDSSAALRFAGAVPGYQNTPSLVIEQVNALVQAGQFTDALAAVESFDCQPCGPGCLPAWTALQLTRCRLLQHHPDRHTEAGPLLRSIRARIEQADPLHRDGLWAVCSNVEVVELEMAAFEGNFRAVEESAGAVLAAMPDGGSLLRLQAQGWLAEARAMGGYQLQATALATDAAARLADAGVDQAAVESAQAHVFHGLLLAGQWNMCADMLTSQRKSPEVVNDLNGPAADVAEGILHALAGRGQLALAKLLPALSQARAIDATRMTVLGEAAAAYAHALTGNLDLAGKHLDRAQARPERLWWSDRQLVVFFTAMAAALQGHSGTAVTSLLDAAKENQVRGAAAVEMLLVCGVVQLGQHSQAERLTKLASEQEGDLAKACELFGRAITTRNPELLLDAAAAALKMNWAPLAFAASGAALPLAEHAQNRRLIRDARRLSTQAQTVGTLAMKTDPNTATLTRREHKIAVLAVAGSTSRDIAEQLHVSARTVEGSLYRVYAKLQISNREQLKLVLR